MSQPWNVFPTLFLERLATWLPPDQVEMVLQALCTQRPTTLRANTLKIDGLELQARLAKQQLMLEPISWWNQGFTLKNASLRELEQHQLYKDGALYVQGLSSMIPPLVLNPQPHEKILDLAAAPGSKTTQMAALMNNTGEIIANDTSLVRLFKLVANLRTQGVTNTKSRRGLGQEVWKKFPEYFDRSLVDVPCSMEGRFNSEKPKTYEQWSARKTKELVLRQRALLRSAVSATKPGGTIVYSTCTLSVEENEAIIDWLLKKEMGAVVVVDISLSDLPRYPSQTIWKHKVFDPQISKTLRILPSPTMEGFFVAKLQKIRPTLFSHF